MFTIQINNPWVGLKNNAYGRTFFNESKRIMLLQSTQLYTLWNNIIKSFPTSVICWLPLQKILSPNNAWCIVRPDLAQNLWYSKK